MKKYLTNGVKPARFRKGDRVLIHLRDGDRLGVVGRGGALCTVVLDGGKKQVVTPAHLLTLTGAPLPRDVATPMDRYALRGYRDQGGEETPRFQATVVTPSGKRILARNDGNGGANLYAGPNGSVALFMEDARAWAAALGHPGLFEPDSFWIQWAASGKPYGQLAKDYLDGLFKE